MSESVGNQTINSLEPFIVSRDFVINAIESETIAQIESYHKQSISGKGDVYTPDEIVEFILDSIGYTAENEIEHSRIIDMACGTGSFTAEIVRRLRDRLYQAGYDPSTIEGARQIVSTIQNNVFAFDSSEDATLRTASVIIRLLENEIKTIGAEEAVSTVPVYKTNTLDKNSNINEYKFEFVVANPPYIRNDDIPEKEQKAYEKNYETATGKFDMYSLFFERGIELLAKNGLLGFVTPDRFHKSNYGQSLRDILTTKTEIKRIINLKDNPFPQVVTYPTITVLKSNNNSQFDLNYQYDTEFDFCLAKTEDLSSIPSTITQRASGDSYSCTKYKQSSFDEGQWEFLPPEVSNIRSHLEKELPTISESNIEFRNGIATAADDIFIIKKSESVSIEDKLLYPIIRGKDIKKGKLDNISHYIINTYDRQGNLIPLEEYPNAAKYLRKHRESLEDRYCVTEKDNSWYEIQHSIDTNKELEQRIVTPDITPEARFAITKGTISHNTCYSIFCRDHIEALAAYFNSSLFECLLKSSMPKINDTHWRQLKRDITQLPVIQPKNMVQNSRLRLKKAFRQKDWESVDDIIFEHLEIEPQQQEYIRAELSSS